MSDAPVNQEAQVAAGKDFDPAVVAQMAECAAAVDLATPAATLTQVRQRVRHNHDEERYRRRSEDGSMRIEVDLPRACPAKLAHEASAERVADLQGGLRAWGVLGTPAAADGHLVAGDGGEELAR